MIRVASAVGVPTGAQVITFLWSRSGLPVMQPELSSAPVASTVANAHKRAEGVFIFTFIIFVVQLVICGVGPGMQEKRRREAIEQ